MIDQDLVTFLFPRITFFTSPSLHHHSVSITTITPTNTSFILSPPRMSSKFTARKKIISLVQRALNFLDNESTIGKTQVEALTSELDNITSKKGLKVALKELSQSQIERIFKIRKVTEDDIGAAWDPQPLIDELVTWNEFDCFMKILSNYKTL